MKVKIYHVCIVVCLWFGLQTVMYGRVEGTDLQVVSVPESFTTIRTAVCAMLRQYKVGIYEESLTWFQAQKACQADGYKSLDRAGPSWLRRMLVRQVLETQDNFTSGSYWTDLFRPDIFSDYWYSYQHKKCATLVADNMTNNEDENCAYILVNSSEPLENASQMLPDKCWQNHSYICFKDEGELQFSVYEGFDVSIQPTTFYREDKFFSTMDACLEDCASIEQCTSLVYNNYSTLCSQFVPYDYYNSDNVHITRSVNVSFAKKTGCDVELLTESSLNKTTYDETFTLDFPNCTDDLGSMSFSTQTDTTITTTTTTTTTEPDPSDTNTSTESVAATPTSSSTTAITTTAAATTLMPTASTTTTPTTGTSTTDSSVTEVQSFSSSSFPSSSSSTTTATPSSSTLSTPSSSLPSSPQSASPSSSPQSSSPSSSTLSTPSSPSSSILSTPTSSSPSSSSSEAMATTASIASPCSCQFCEAGNFSEAEIEILIQNIVSKLRIAVNKTSAYRRTKTSAEDNRPEAKAIGAFGVFVTIVILSVPLFLDLTNFTNSYKQKVKVASAKTEHFCKS